MKKQDIYQICWLIIAIIFLFQLCGIKREIKRVAIGNFNSDKAFFMEEREKDILEEKKEREQKEKKQKEREIKMKKMEEKVFSFRKLKKEEKITSYQILKKAGYSDDEIQDYLRPKFSAAGFSNAEINQYFQEQEKN